MHQPDYQRIEEMLRIIKVPNNAKCLKLYRDNKERFMEAPGALHNHQNWPGGYHDHIAEILNIACVMYPVMNNLRSLPFDLSDALIVLFLHDIEKPWRYRRKEGTTFEKIPGILDSKESRHVFRLAKIKEYKIRLNAMQMNALTYVEGENDAYKSNQRVMNPLAAFCHICDVTSARIWYSEPSERKMSSNWRGSYRMRD